VGALYKPAANGSLYVAYANSRTPPGGVNCALSASATNVDSPSLDPQETSNVELGTKWDLMDSRLNVSAAIYRTENDKQISYNQDTGTYAQFGKTRVEGIELAASGDHHFWQVSAGIAKMNTKSLDQASRKQQRRGFGKRRRALDPGPDGDPVDLLHPGPIHPRRRPATCPSRSGWSPRAPCCDPEHAGDPSYWVADLMAAYKLNRNVNCG